MKHLKHISWTLVISLMGVLLFLTSCGRPGKEISSLSFPDKCWGIEDTVHVTTDQWKEVQNPTVVIHFQADYSYQNIYLKAIVTDAAGKVSEHLSTHNVLSQGGEWLVPQKGSDYEAVLPLNLPEHTQSLKLIQYMREEELCEIRGVSVVAM